MSKEYYDYLTSHIDNVKKAYKWLIDKGIIERHSADKIDRHDASKTDYVEYDAYDNYFYGERTEEVKKAFDYAWLHHIHENPHHWQHWVLFNDEDGTYALEMPKQYVIEMVCDWWTFSWKEGNLYEVFNWYEEHKDKMILHTNTRVLVEEYLNKIKEVLDNESGIN